MKPDLLEAERATFVANADGMLIIDESKILKDVDQKGTNSIFERLKKFDFYLSKLKSMIKGRLLQKS